MDEITRESFLEILYKDSEFLAKFNIMDYSLLLAV